MTILKFRFPIKKFLIPAREAPSAVTKGKWQTTDGENMGTQKMAV